jgi:CubicO group peptidase (beta-lactamase class C family)
MLRLVIPFSNAPPGVAAARELIAKAVERRVFPAAVAEVGDARNVLWRQSFGALSFGGTVAARDETIFDLASLTKPMATAAALLSLEATGRIDLREPVATFFDEWRGQDRERVTIVDLLEHASGLAARLVDAPPEGRREFEHEICTMPLEYEPRSRALYSDLGFILLGFIVADRGGAPFSRQFGAIVQLLRSDLGDGDVLGFGVDADSRSRTAPTIAMEADRRRGQTLVGEVHDNYAHLLGGSAGHAGLFGTAGAVGAYARGVLKGARGDHSMPAPFSPPLVARSTERSRVPESSRALGWDTMLPTSSCGSKMSPNAFGHVGFTGTSLWIDPARDRYFVLLTNRACGGGTLDEMRDLRRAFHDAFAKS